MASALSLLLFATHPGGAAPTTPPPRTGPPAADRPAGDSAAVHLVIDTVAVDGQGTRLIGTDEADLRPGAVGVLEKSVPLVGRGAARRKETVRLKARVMPLPGPPAGAGCSVQVDIEASPDLSGAAGRGGTGSPETVTATLTLGPGEERLVEAYASTMTEGRVALKVRCSPALAQASTDDEAHLVALNVTIERSAEGEQAELLRNQVLTAALARSASIVASANRTLPDGASGDRRYRSESLEVVLSPILFVAGKLQIDVRVGGEVATVSASEETVRHPVEASETFVVGSGEPRIMEIEVLSGGPDEGWGRVRFRVQVAGSF